MKRTVPACLLTLGLFACAMSPSTGADRPGEASGTVTFPDRGHVLHVRIAEDDTERERGLMGVPSMPNDQGMAFVFDQATSATFWMKDTLLPLSIAFVDAKGTIVTITEMTPCHVDTCRTYGSSMPFVLAIEANAGWFAANGIREGDLAILERGVGAPSSSGG